MEDVSEPLAESMEKVAEAVLLFCQVLKPHRRLEDAGMMLKILQGMGLLPTLQRRISRQDSRGNSTRDDDRC